MAMSLISDDLSLLHEVNIAQCDESRSKALKENANWSNSCL